METPQAAGARGRVATGVPGLDEILGGGLRRGGIYVVTGGPGTGKTVAANQLCFARGREGERCLYVSVLSESHARMVDNLSTFAFFDADLVGDRLTYLSGARMLRDGNLEGLLALIEQELRRREPSLIVLDGLSIGVQLAAIPHAPALRAFLNRLATLLEVTDTTAIVCTLAPSDLVTGEYAIADGLIELTHERVRRRSVRELFVRKLRGSLSLGGSHVFEIDERGLVVHPRFEARFVREPHVPRAPGGRHRLGIERLDEMLRGGVPVGSTTAVIGATGAGKTLLALHFLAAGAARGEPGVYFGFYESPARVIAAGDALGLGLGDHVRAGRIDVAWQRPVEQLLDPMADELLERVRRAGARRAVIDGVEGFERAAVFPYRVPALLAALLNELRALDVTTVLTLESQLLGAHVVPEETWSALVENTILLRYVELRSQLHRLVSIVKVRGSDFDTAIREFVISDAGIDVADTFESAEAVLSGLARARPDVPPGGGEAR